MYPGETGRPDQAFADREELAGLRSQLAERDRTVGALTAIVDRQIGLIERYETVTQKGGGQPDRSMTDALDRTIFLLDQAVATVERRARDVAALESHLDRTLSLLDQSLKNQETLVSKGFDSSARSASPAMEETLAKYDQMLERSLAALETAYRANQSTQKEVGDRDRLLKKTMDLLENSVEANGGPRRAGLLGRLFM